MALRLILAFFSFGVMAAFPFFYALSQKHNAAADWMAAAVAGIIEWLIS